MSIYSVWTVEYFYAKIRASELKPTMVATVYLDPEGHPWTVDLPHEMTPEDREDTFARLERRRGR